jgi:D-alanyl-D-alanine carboxypeptidase/D-alanyl-D-alanine-endopeptidase (penicillin-binding protein 4)
MRRVLSLVVIAALAVAADVRAAPDAGPAPTVVPELEAPLRALRNAVKDAKVGVYVVDLETDKVLAFSDEHVALNPASNAKLYTAAAALAMLHPEHRYETSLAGKVKDGAAAGLVLRGHGDPSLTAEDLHAMARELHDRGIKRVEGDLLVDQRFFDEKTTPPAFEQKPSEWAAFRAPVSAVSLDENTVTLTVRPGEEGAGAHAWFEPRGFVDVEGSVSTAAAGAPDTVTLALSANGKRLSAKLGGAVSADAKLVRYTRRVDDPTLLAGYALRAELDDAGVKVSGDVKLGSSAKAPVLVRHSSASLAQLLFELGKQSDNFYAETVFKTIAAEQKGRPGASEDSAALVTKWLQTVGAWDEGMQIKNGSGLYDANRVTAWSAVQLLRFAWRTAEIEPDFVAQLAIGGEDGTLHKRFRAFKAHRAIRAKTGTLEGAIALSGYVLGPPGKAPLAFSVIFNGVEGRGSDARTAIDRFVSHVAAIKWPQ